MGDPPGDCENCRQHCLKRGAFFHRITNVSDADAVKGKVFYLTPQMINFLLSHLQRQFKNRPLFDVVNAHLGICPWSIQDVRAGEILERYFFTKNFNMPPFSGAFDDVPEWYRQAVRVIENEMNLCMKSWRKKDG